MAFIRDIALAGAFASSVTGAISQSPRYSDRVYPMHDAIPPEGKLMNVDMGFVMVTNVDTGFASTYNLDLRFFPEKLPLWFYMSPLDAEKMYGPLVGIGAKAKVYDQMYLLPSVDFRPTIRTKEEKMKKFDPTYSGGDCLLQDGMVGLTVRGTVLSGEKFSSDFSLSMRKYLESKAEELYFPVTVWAKMPTREGSNYESIHAGIGKDFGNSALGDVYLRFYFIADPDNVYGLFRGERGKFEVGLGTKDIHDINQYSVMVHFNYDGTGYKPKRPKTDERGSHVAREYGESIGTQSVPVKISAHECPEPARAHGRKTERSARTRN